MGESFAGVGGSKLCGRRLLRALAGVGQAAGLAGACFCGSKLYGRWQALAVAPLIFFHISFTSKHFTNAALHQPHTNHTVSANISH
jgi:hypothetical protein